MMSKCFYKYYFHIFAQLFNFSFQMSGATDNWLIHRIVLHARIRPDTKQR